MTRSRNIHAYWEDRASLGQSAGTNDLIAKQLEIEAITKHIRDGMRVMDAGCGNGITAVEVAGRFDVDVKGCDFSEEMIRQAREKASGCKLKGSVSFQVADIGNIPRTLGDFNLIYTERSLINLSGWADQKQAIQDISSFLVDGGLYVMCENSQDGLDRINALREDLGLSRIEPPWHNRYMVDAEIEQCAIPGVKLEGVQHFSSTYYLLSRVVNAWLAEQEGSAPDYNAPVNQLALKLPPFGDLAQTRIWLWRKTDEPGPSCRNHGGSLQS
jgi:ubiquinone/menaquinone biosynthesis C-methylase UbiE